MGTATALLERLAAHRLARLYILDFGLFQVGANDRIIGIPGYLLETTEGARILIDTGFPAEYAAAPADTAKRDGLERFGHILRLTAENLPAGQLARVGLTAADIDLVILTHGHIDHVGCLDQFTHCPILVSKAERAFDRPIYFEDMRPLDWPRADYHLIDADTDICAGLRLLLTPGHSPGHIAAMLTLPATGAVLLTADAIARPEEVSEGFDGAWNPPMAQASAARILAMADPAGAFIIYGHGPEQWPLLRKIPEFYG